MESLKHKAGVLGKTCLEVKGWACTSVSPAADKTMLQCDKQETQNDHEAPRVLTENIWKCLTVGRDHLISFPVARALRKQWGQIGTSVLPHQLLTQYAGSSG